MALCPYCFNKINLRKLDMRCTSKSCCEPGSTERHIIPRKLARTDIKGYGACDVCGKSTHILVCSSCKHDLPDTINDSETKIISIIGTKGSGKSYYVAALLRQIMDMGLLARVAGASTRFLPESREIYENRYKKNMDKCLPLEGTNLVTDIVKDNPPVLVNVSFSNSRNKKVDYTYSFFDAAGESFSDPAVLASITPYIAHSEAIIVLLDPRQIEAVNSAVSASIPNLPAISPERYEDTINNVADVIYNSLRLNRRNKIDIPICVAFSKWDLLINTPGLLPGDFIVSQPSLASVNGFDPNVVENSSAEIRSLLNEWSTNLQETVEKLFKTVCYFGFSAWGLGSKDGSKIPPIASFRVEDPLLWIMNRDKLLK